MDSIDLPYIVRSIGALSGVPVRLYEGGALRCAWFPAALPRDPVALYRGEIFSIDAHVGYFVTPLFHCYGVLNAGDAKLVVGPTSQIMAGEQELRALAFQCDVPKEEVPAFLSGMDAIVRMPAESLLQMLCTAARCWSSPTSPSMTRSRRR